MIQTTDHHLTREQIQFLNRGPSYIIPCQMHLLSKLPLKQILHQQFLPLQQQLTKFFQHYPVEQACQLKFEKSIQQEFIKSFSISIPTWVKQRVFYEEKLMKSIQYQLKQDNLILRRTSDDMNTYYLGRRTEFKQMCATHFETSLWYEFISSSTDDQDLLNELLSSIKLKLEQYQQREYILSEKLLFQYQDQMRKYRLPYLYFLPHMTTSGYTSIERRFSSYENYPTNIIATHLDQLLRPLFEQLSRSTTCVNGTDFIQKLQDYCKEEFCLTNRTNFVVFKIYNLAKRLSHPQILLALNRFLNESFMIEQFDNNEFSIPMIEELTRLVLEKNYFSYQNKLYRHTKGGPLNLSYFRLLLNIYLHYWQLPIIRLTENFEFYTRYHDTMLFTWDGSEVRLAELMMDLNLQNPDIQLTTSRGRQVNFLHAHIENKYGHLYTRVYHDYHRQQPFLLPYTNYHPRIFYRQWFRFLLIRAGQYCNLVEDFHNERRRIELTFLANGYSSHFIECQLRNFFKTFNTTRDLQTMMDLNYSTYAIFRRQLLPYIHLQYQRNYQRDQELEKNQQLIQFSYLYDWGLRCQFNAKFQKYWLEYLYQDPKFRNYNLKYKLTSKHYYTSNTLLSFSCQK